uniref:NADH dehydrogenase subunit 4L n=1 Tax=Cyphocaris challengeri TaxID=3018532 RepID=UPI0022FD85CF|nr:NADH dehydrogenase subunit 4L [Cyphocaris challengeri]WBQ48843.1 NADH dehydrogenase subunit 4L [Cyphocaris challengeri]
MVLKLLGIVMVLSGFIMFALSYNHILISMLSLELMGLGVFFYSLIMFSGFTSEVYYSLYLLIMMVCEGVLGVSLVIMMSLSLGSEDFSVFSGVC